MAYRSLQNQFDPLDKEIMSALTEDARIPFAQLAQQLRVSNSLSTPALRSLRTRWWINEFETRSC
ncbi:MAG: AsnC family transcriptional regulator [Bacteroidota bacterium]